MKISSARTLRSPPRPFPKAATATPAPPVIESVSARNEISPPRPDELAIGSARIRVPAPSSEIEWARSDKRAPRADTPRGAADRAAGGFPGPAGAVRTVELLRRILPLLTIEIVLPVATASWLLDVSMFPVCAARNPNAVGDALVNTSPAVPAA